MTDPVTFFDGRMTLYGDDCIRVLAVREPNSVDAVVTDPPYELGFMGKSWDGSGIAFKAETWREVLRVLKPGGHLVAFGAPRNGHRLTCAIEDAGFEIRDRVVELIEADAHVAAFLNSLSPAQIDGFLRCLDDSAFGSELQWVFGGGFPKSIDFAKDRETSRASGRRIALPEFSHTNFETGFGTALKPAYEPIILARKPLIGTVAENVLAHGTGAINIDACRVATDENLNGGAYAAAGGRASLSGDEREGAAQGMFQPGKTAGREYEQPKGRWPANLVHDGSEEVLAAFPETSSGKPGIMREGKNHSSAFGVESRPPGTPMTGFGDAGSAARFFYTAKADSDDRIGSKHPTVKPLDLMRWLVRLVTPPGGTILDPFAGTGTTGEAALYEGFNAILIEREAEYIADIGRRMKHVLSGPAERKRAIGKAKARGDDSAGPLFGASA